MADLPGPDELLATMATLLDELGVERCLSAPTLTRDPEFFPDAWTPTLRGVRAVVRRLFGHAERTLSPDIVDRRAGDKYLGGDFEAGVLYVDLGADGPIFEVSAIGDPRAMVGPLCVEAARALLELARQEARGGGYRVAADEDLDLPDDVEALIAAVLLGWGAPVANATFDPRAVGETVGYDIRTARVTGTLEYPPELVTWLVAAWLTAQADPERVLDHSAALLPRQRGLLDDALAELAPRTNALRERMRLPEQAVPTRSLNTIPFEHDAEDDRLDELEAQRAHHQRFPNFDEPVFRLQTRSVAKYAALGFVGGIAATIASPGLIFMALGGGAVSGAAFGWTRTRQVCSYCNYQLEPDDPRCNGCGGQIVGDVKNQAERVEAEERWRAEHGQPET